MSNVQSVMWILIWSQSAALWLTITTTWLMLLMWDNDGLVNKSIKLLLCVQLIISVIALLGFYISSYIPDESKRIFA